MKKTVLTIAIVLGIALGASAQNGGLFGKGPTRGYEEDFNNDRNFGLLSLPNSHGETEDVTAPLGSGLLMLLTLGGGYALTRRKHKECKKAVVKKK